MRQAKEKELLPALLDGKILMADNLHHASFLLLQQLVVLPFRHEFMDLAGSRHVVHNAHGLSLFCVHIFHILSKFVNRETSILLLEEFVKCFFSCFIGRKYSIISANRRNHHEDLHC